MSYKGYAERASQLVEGQVCQLTEQMQTQRNRADRTTKRPADLQRQH